MGFARKMARELREEARQLQSMGMPNLAIKRELDAEMYERIADEVETEEQQPCR